MRSAWLYVFAVLCLLATSAGAAAADAAAGKATYAACAGCHGTSGEGSQVVNAPRLAGLDATYVVRQTTYFQKGIRGAEDEQAPGAAMAAVAKALDATAIANVAAYIETLETIAPKPTVSGDIAKGKTLYAACAACHGADGAGNTALNSPRLAGGSDWYLVRQLRNYKSGKRGAHKDDAIGKQMAPMVAVLADDQAIADVVAYINTLGD